MHSRLFDFLNARTRLGDAVLQEKAAEKIKEFSGVIDEDSALKLIARELNVELPPEKEENPSQLSEVVSKKIANPGVLVRVLKIFSPKRFETEKGKGKVCNLEVADSSGKAILVLWNEDVAHLEKEAWERDAVLKIRNARVRSFNPLELESTMLTELSLSGETEHLAEETKQLPRSGKKHSSISSLKEGSEADVFARVLEVGALKEFERNNKKGFVLNALLADDSSDSSKIKAVFWDDNAVSASKHFHVGLAVKLEGAKVKKGLQGLELHAGWDSHVVLNPKQHSLQSSEELLKHSFPSSKLSEVGEKGVIVSAAVSSISSLSILMDSLHAAALLEDSSGKQEVVFNSREALRLLGLRHVPRIEPEALLALREPYLKGKCVEVVVRRGKKSIEALHLISIQ